MIPLFPPRDPFWIHSVQLLSVLNPNLQTSQLSPAHPITQVSHCPAGPKFGAQTSQLFPSLSCLTCDAGSLPVVEDHVSWPDHRGTQQATPVHHYSWSRCQSRTLGTRTRTVEIFLFSVILRETSGFFLVPSH